MIPNPLAIARVFQPAFFVRIPKTLSFRTSREHAVKVVKAHTLADNALEASKYLMNIFTGITIIFFLFGITPHFSFWCLVVGNAALAMAILWRFLKLSDYMIWIMDHVQSQEEKQKD